MPSLFVIRERRRWYVDILARRAFAPMLLTVALTLRAAPLAAQAGGIVAGVVIDATSLRPLDNVQVGVEGRSASAVTDGAGGFRFTNVPGTQVTLQFRRIGYKATNETVAVGRTDLRIALVTQPTMLSEVVISGTAEPIEKRALGNSVTKIEAFEVQQVAPAYGVSSLINGRAPGVVIIAGSGAIGAGPRMRIRGAGSLSLSDQPLVYVDGVRINSDVSSGPTSQAFGSGIISRLNDINPDDIDNIEIVKGPSAATLYGTEANNGVVLITTRRGKPGRTVFNATARVGTSEFANAQERIGWNYSRNAAGQIERWNPVDAFRKAGFDLFKTGKTQSYSATANGGSEQVRFNLTGGYENQTGIEPTNDLWRYTGNANLSVLARSNLDMNASIGLNQQQIDLPQEAGGGMWFAAFYGQAPLTQLDSLRYGFRSAPPQAYWRATQLGQQASRVISSLTINHRIGEIFSQRLTVGNDLTQETNTSYTGKMDAYLSQWFTSATTQAGSKSSTRRELQVSSIDYAGTIKTKLPSNILANTSGGVQYFRRNTYSVTATGQNFPVAGLSTVDAAGGLPGAGESYVANSTLGFYGQEQFNINDRFFLTGALRVDNNSAFGSNFSWVKYPKIQAAWVVNEEGWFKNIGFLRRFDALKLRAALGETGQQPLTNSALRTFRATGTADGSGVSPNSIGNPDLRPERSREIEAGFDAAAFGNRITAEFNVYRRDTRDAILSQSVAPSTGFAGTRFTNIGKIRSQGLEAQARATLIERERFNLDFTVSASRNDNTVMDIGAAPGTPLDQQFIGTGSIRHQVGYPVGSFWELKVLSSEFDPANPGKTKNTMCDDGKGGATPCLNAAGQAIAPRVYMGRGDSPNEGSFSSTATLFKRFRFYGLVDWKRGNVQFDNDYRIRCQIYYLCMANLNPLEADPKLIAQYNTSNILRTTFYSDAGYAKLREVSASYVLPNRYAAMIGTTAATLTLSGRNLMTWSNWSSVDPESFWTVEQFARTAQAQVPPLRQFLFSINATF
jgi:TonB-linked SusC/RagA family outer membrane protein